MTTIPARRVRRSERVAAQIVELIEARGLRPGDLLPTETELMQHMGVGRSSVREALRGLAVLGQVEVRQGQGTFVQSPVPLSGPQALNVGAIAGALGRGVTEDLLEARAIIEVRAAALAARRATAEDIAALRELVESARAARGTRPGGLLLSADFHLGVARAAHNSVLEGFVASYIPVLAERAGVLQRLPGYLDWELREHEAIGRAVAAHDARLAAARMRAHLQDMAIHYDHLRTTGLRLPAAPGERGQIGSPKGRAHG